MIQSKAWNWAVSEAPQWVNAAGEVYPLIKRWKILNFSKCLDLGCGVGRHTLLMAANGFEVTATDLSEDGMVKLEERAKEENLKITTKIADMISLPFENDLFDCLIAYHAIYHTDDEGIKKVMKEIERVLKPGGEALITFNSQKGTSFKDPKNKRLTANTIVKESGNEAGIPHFYATKEDVEKLIADFEIIEFTHKEEYFTDSDYVGAHYCVVIRKK